MLYLESRETDPCWNLALEQYLFDTVGKEEDLFLLWRNRSSVIVGKHQNTFAEINAPFLRSHGIPAVRRLSGGGAVYHDLGNVNFTYITGRGGVELMNLRLFCTPLLETLGEFGVEAMLSGRNDVTIDGKKFSGNSQYTDGKRLLHHGTILFQTDMEMMRQALTPSCEKMEAKGTASVRSRVINLSEALRGRASQEEFQRRFARKVLEKTGGAAFRLTEEDRAAVDRLARERYASWEWNYGASPPCTAAVRRYLPGCGTVEVSLQAEGGRISSVKFTGDFFGERPLEELEALFCGERLEPEAFARVWAPAPVPSYLHGIQEDGFLQLFPLL